MNLDYALLLLIIRESPDDDLMNTEITIDGKQHNLKAYIPPEWNTFVLGCLVNLDPQRKHFSLPWRTQLEPLQTQFETQSMQVEYGSSWAHVWVGLVGFMLFCLNLFTLGPNMNVVSGVIWA